MQVGERVYIIDDEAMIRRMLKAPPPFTTSFLTNNNYTPAQRGTWPLSPHIGPHGKLSAASLNAHMPHMTKQPQHPHDTTCSILSEYVMMLLLSKQRITVTSKGFI